MAGRLRFMLNRIGEQLWVRPLAIGALSVGAAFLAHGVDGTGLGEHVPSVAPASIESLLSIISSSMLVIATFAVASMVAAYASASRTATPRALSLVIADDVSQNALSTFIGAFIFSIVARVALQNEYYGTAGRFVLFALTLATFAIVIITFVRWVDRIARLGRVGATIETVEEATHRAIKHRRQHPTLGGVPIGEIPDGEPVPGAEIGFVQRIDTDALERFADECNAIVAVESLPGTFVAPGRPVARLIGRASGTSSPEDIGRIAKAFKIGRERHFDEDPRFGLVVLSETAIRALSPAVNDPGTAVQVLGGVVRLLAAWAAPACDDEPERCPRVRVPRLATQDLVRDAFAAIARDGASMVEVAVAVQDALAALAAIGDPELTTAVREESALALQRAELALVLPADIEAVRRAAGRAPG
ncbi:MAG: DUF2254 domain-containing protein [Gemmatimonadales bacterium]|nr:DUF2254 domain-containing protein [Gemmatimonadales bacterium]